MKISKTQIFRLVSLIFFIVVVLIASYRHQKLGGGPTGSPSVDTICPFGGLETIYKVVAGGNFLKRTGPSNIILFITTIILTIILGRFFCGWICALGGLQEFATKLRNVTIKKRFIIPLGFDKYLRYLKYVLLVVILFFTWKLQDMVIRPYDPFATFSHIFAGFEEIFTGFLVGFIILILSLVLSFFFDRFFCKYLCPLGAFLGIVYKIFPFYKIKRDEKTCINCNKCSNVCPVNIPVAKLDKVNNAECINCMECVSSCPTKKDTLQPTIFKLFLKAFIVGIVGLSIYLGAILITNVTGIWKSGEESFEKILKTDGKLNPYNIRGFMTLKDISREFKIDINKLYESLNITRELVPENTKMKEFSKIVPSLNEEFVRDTVAKLIGYEGTKKTQNIEKDRSENNKKEDDSTKSKSTTDSLKTENQSNETDLTKSKSTTENKSIETGSTKTVDNNKILKDSFPEVSEIKGSWTIQDLLDTYKLTKEELYRELNNYCKEKKIESYNFSNTTTLKTIKEKISVDNPDFEVQTIREAVRKLRK